MFCLGFIPRDSKHRLAARDLPCLPPFKHPFLSLDLVAVLSRAEMKQARGLSMRTHFAAVSVGKENAVTSPEGSTISRTDELTVI